jgi:hypothetical protein
MAVTLMLAIAVVVWTAIPTVAKQDLIIPNSIQQKSLCIEV